MVKGKVKVGAFLFRELNNPYVSMLNDAHRRTLWKHKIVSVLPYIQDLDDFSWHRWIQNLKCLADATKKA